MENLVSSIAKANGLFPLSIKHLKGVILSLKMVMLPPKSREKQA
jgi:hypothetical protein